MVELQGAQEEVWPALPLAAWRDTYATLHMYTQIVGKIRLGSMPMMNQWWQVPLYLSARGLTTSPMPHGSRTFEIEFDFIDHNLVLRTSEGATRALALIPRSVADFHAELMTLLHTLDLDVHVWPMPVEVPNPVRFTEDRQHAAYDPVYAHRFWQVLRQVDMVFKTFRARFRGKCSPVQFFWGTFDLTVSRYSGRPAPPRPDADRITRLAYDEEVSSIGFWPGSGEIEDAAFFAYTAPEPAGLPKEPVRPASAFYSQGMKLFILMYDEVRRAAHPEQVLLEFAQSTYEAGARLAKWDRAALERE